MSGIPCSSAARSTTHRLCTDTRTRLPREARARTNWLLRKSLAAGTNRSAASPTWGVPRTRALIGPRNVTSHVRHFGFEVTFGAFNSLFKTKAIIYMSVRLSRRFSGSREEYEPARIICENYDDSSSLCWCKQQNTPTDQKLHLSV